MEYTAEEKEQIILALRDAASYQSKLWDTLRDVENMRGCDIDIDDQLVGILACECDIANCVALSDDDVWEVFEEHATVTEHNPLPKGE